MAGVRFRRDRWWVHSPCVGLCLLVMVGVSGCGGSGFGDVSGIVTLDGEPLENALVQFKPEQGPRPSQARTDGEGFYELNYTRSQSGAVTGMHEVIISTYDEDAGRPELVPMKYNVDTELTVEVEEGHNQVDFGLDSDGEIYQGEGY